MFHLTFQVLFRAPKNRRRADAAGDSLGHVWVVPEKLGPVIEKHRREVAGCVLRLLTHGAVSWPPLLQAPVNDRQDARVRRGDLDAIGWFWR